MLWLTIDKSRLQGILLSFYGNYPKNSLSWDFSISIWNMVSYDFPLYMLKIETMTRGTNSMPFHDLQRDHLRSTSGIICGSGSFAAQFGNHFQSGDHLRSGIICGWGSFAALYSTETTLAFIRQRFWFTQGRHEVKRVLRKCLACKCCQIQPIQQKMAPLPAERVQIAPPFTNIGLDFTGPLYRKVKGSSKPTTQRSVCAFSSAKILVQFI